MRLFPNLMKSSNHINANLDKEREYAVKVNAYFKDCEDIKSSNTH